METSGFYKVQYSDGAGKLHRVAVVADSLEDVSVFVQRVPTMIRPKIRAMTQAEVRKWRGKVLYPPEKWYNNHESYSHRKEF